MAVREEAREIGPGAHGVICLYTVGPMWGIRLAQKSGDGAGCKGGAPRLQVQTDPRTSAADELPLRTRSTPSGGRRFLTGVANRPDPGKSLQASQSASRLVPPWPAARACFRMGHRRFHAELRSLHVSGLDTHHAPNFGDPDAAEILRPPRLCDGGVPINFDMCRC
jgi:hypothetical protein